MARVHYAVQVLEPRRLRSGPRWLTVATATRLAVAETILKSVRQDRLKVAALSRLRPVIRLPYRAKA